MAGDRLINDITDRDIDQLPQAWHNKVYIRRWT